MATETRCPGCGSWYVDHDGPQDRSCQSCGYEWKEVDNLEDTESAEASTA